MKRGFLVAVGSAALVVAGLSGCSSDDKSAEASEASPTANATVDSTASPGTSVAAGDATATTGTGTARVVIDGAEHPIEGSVVCATVAGNVSVTVGQGTSAVTATLSEGDQPAVSAVALGNIDGVSLATRRVCRVAAQRPPRTATSTRSRAVPPALTWPTRWPVR